MSLLAAHDQENLVHSLQAGAAGKSLNAGLKSTNKPPKTPFKVSLNDENAVNKAGKSMLKEGKPSNAFVTPAVGPRTSRAPLGMKTTNAKAKVSQTLAPLSASGKTQKLSPRLRRPKVKVHQPEVQTEEENDVPEVEYMPPKETPLPDDLDEDMPPINWDFPQFKGANMTRGAFSIYHNPVEDDGRTRGERELDESLARERKKANEEFDKLFADIMAKEDAEARRYLGIESPKKPAPKEQLPKKQIPAPSTVKARAAAAALSPASHPRPTLAIPTAKSRLPTGLIASKKVPPKPVLNPSASRNAAAVAASKSTIGYAQGRAASSSLVPRKPLSNVSRPAPTTTLSKRPPTASSRPTTAPSIRSRSATSTSAPRSRGPFSRTSSTSTNATLVSASQHEEQEEQEQEPYRTAEDVEREMALLLLQEEDEEGDAAWMESFKTQLEGPDAVDDEYADFQLTLPEGL